MTGSKQASRQAVVLYNLSVHSMRTAQMHDSVLYSSEWDNIVFFSLKPYDRQQLINTVLIVDRRHIPIHLQRNALPGLMLMHKQHT